MQTLDQKIYSNTGNRDVLRLAGDGKSVLDIGCGDGSLAKLLKAGGREVDGISISPSELEKAGAVLRKGYLYNLELGLPKEIPDDHYDMVICSHVLEHVAYPDAVLKDIRRVLRPGGQFIVALPNLFHYRSRWQLLRGNFKTEDAGIWDYTHMRWYTFQSAQDLLGKYGFQLLVATVTGEVPFNSVLKRILPAGVRRGLFKLLQTISKGFFGYQLLYSFNNTKSRP